MREKTAACHASVDMAPGPHPCPSPKGEGRMLYNNNMPKLFRPDMHQCVDGRRWTVGALVSSRCTWVSAALVGAGGSGRNLLVEVVQAAEAEVPRQTVALFNDLTGSGTGQDFGGDDRRLPRAIGRRFKRCWSINWPRPLALSTNRILALGVHDPGLWDTVHGESAGYLGLCDAARLAEATGMNVSTHFPPAIWPSAAGAGRHGRAEWMLLRSQTPQSRTIGFGPHHQADISCPRLPAESRRMPRSCRSRSVRHGHF